MADEPINIVNQIPGQEPPVINVHVELNPELIANIVEQTAVAVGKAVAKQFAKALEMMPAPVVNVEHPKRSFTIEHDDGTKTQVTED